MSTLYVSDLDGTLLQPDGTLSDFARETLNHLLDEGLLFTVATGRQYFALRDALIGLRLRLPVVEMDGAFVTDLHTGQPKQMRSFERDAAVSLLDHIERQGMRPFINSFAEARHFLSYHSAINAGMEWYVRRRQLFSDPRLRQMNELQTAVSNEATVGFILIDSQPRLAELQASLTDWPDVTSYLQENHYSPGWFWLTIRHHTAQKHHGIQLVREQLPNPVDRVVVFGDQPNDLSMLRFADWGVAVDNAATAVHAVANERIGPNSADSVVRYILADWQGR